MEDEALNALSLTEDCLPANDLRITRSRELQFFDTHPELERQLAGQWVALDGDEVVGHGPDLDDVLQQAEDAGHPDPFVTRILDPAVTYVF